MLPTGLKYSSLAKRSMPFTASDTCGVGRRTFPSNSKRLARREVGLTAGRSACAGGRRGSVFRRARGPSLIFADELISKTSPPPYVAAQGGANSKLGRQRL